MKRVNMKFSCWSIVYDDGKMLVKTFSSMEWGAFKRSKLFKKILTKRKLFEFEIVVKVQQEFEKL